MDKKLKVTITGHTSGIGKSIADKFSAEGYAVVGFSPSNGIDIKEVDSRNKILESLNDSDVFVNNAYFNEGQTSLLKDAIAKWAGQDKLIINISSKFVFRAEQPNLYKEYINNKIEQNKIIEGRMMAGFPRVMNVMPGIVDTKMAHIFEAPKVDPTELATLIYNSTQYKTLVVQQLIVDVPGLDWKDIKVTQ